MPGSRTYPGVASPISNENYEAILVGDVTGNWAASPPGAPAIDEPEPKIERHSRSSLLDHLIWNRDGAESSDAVRLELPKTARASRRSEMILPIVLGDTTGKGIVAYEFTLDYDPGALTPALEPATTADTLSSGWALAVNSNTPGRLKVVAYSTQAG